MRPLTKIVLRSLARVVSEPSEEPLRAVFHHLPDADFKVESSYPREGRA